MFFFPSSRFKYFECNAYGTCESLTVADYVREPEIYCLYLACIFHSIFWFFALKIADVVKDGGLASSAFACSRKVTRQVSYFTGRPFLPTRSFFHGR